MDWVQYFELATLHSIPSFVTLWSKGLSRPHKSFVSIFLDAKLGINYYCLKSISGSKLITVICLLKYLEKWDCE